MNTTLSCLFQTASKNGYIVNHQTAVIKASKKIVESFDNGLDIYVVEIILYSVRGKIASRTYKEFPLTEKGNQRADKLIEYVTQN